MVKFVGDIKMWLCWKWFVYVLAVFEFWWPWWACLLGFGVVLWLFSGEKLDSAMV